jgi:integrase
MASISTNQKTGCRRILFTRPDGIRKKITLGKIPMKNAQSIKARVEDLVAAAWSGNTPDPSTSEWVGKRDDVFYAKLAAVGLVPERAAMPGANAQILGPFLQAYIDGRSDVKPGTRINLKQAQQQLLRFFGAEKPLSAITPGDADEFRLDLMSRLAENTARRFCGRAKQYFRVAVRKKIIKENPFGDMKQCSVKGNPSRFYFITREEAEKVLAACPDAQWRLLFALSRFGGLRCPSEHCALRWGDVDWERGRITVHSPKTESHEGGESRQIPIFPELRPYLEEAWEQAEPGTEFVITRYRDGNSNLRTQLQRIIRRAGLTPWPKLWQNLRSTRETELAESYPLHVVCAWIGNSQKVAAKHYLQVRDSDFEKACALGEGGAKSGAPGAQNRAQEQTVKNRTNSHEKTKALAGEGLAPINTGYCCTIPLEVVTPTGTEHIANSSGNQGVALQGGAKSGALGDDSADFPPDLAEVVAAWPTMPATARQRVLALVREANGE